MEKATILGVADGAGEGDADDKPGWTDEPPEQPTKHGVRTMIQANKRFFMIKNSISEMEWAGPAKTCKHFSDTQIST